MSPACAVWLVFVLASAPSARAEPPTLRRTDLEVDGHRFHAEVAADDESRMRGLMFRDELADDAAMLFVFDTEQTLAFWMKNTRIPLDILYFDGSGYLVSQQTAVPPCRVALCPQYPSERPARFVVEVPAGTSKRLSIRPGASLCWPADFGPPLAACRKPGGKP